MTKSYTVDDVCAEHGISRQLKIGRCVRISETAKNEWIAALETAAVAA